MKGVLHLKQQPASCPRAVVGCVVVDRFFRTSLVWLMIRLPTARGGDSVSFIKYDG